MATFQSLLRNSSRLSLTNISPLLRHYSSNTTVDSKEINKFTLSVHEWWNDIQGPAAPLHSMNYVRVPLIKEALCGTRDIYGEELGTGEPLKGYTCLDVGCGGGILCESLGKLGATVTGIDPNPTAISVAKSHLSHTNRYHSTPIHINYQCISVEELVQYNSNMEKNSAIEKGPITGGSEAESEGGSEGVYDCVIASEVLEHVSNVREFIQHISTLVKPAGGSVVFSTLNRTLPSLLLAKMAAEYILHIVPPGTHDWNKFITPEELEMLLIENGFSSITLQGLAFNPFTYQWSYTNDTCLNYCMYAIKK